MNRIASDEPDQVGVLPKAITFWHRGKSYQAAVSSSAVPIDRLLKAHQGGIYQFTGDYGRAWLADPCTQALHESLHASRLTRAEERRREAAIARKLKGG